MRIKKVTMILLSCLLIVAMFPAASLANTGAYATKDEVIYAKLQANGTVENMYVVNSFAITTPGEMIDFGAYHTIRNLTDLSDIEQVNQNEIRFQADEDFYYQGELENQPLPWDISITYVLDGKEIQASELAGESGHLEIRIETAANDAVDPVFFDYYMLQIGLTLDPLVFNQIHAPEGTEANEGKNKRINFTVLPEQEELFIVSANVVDLEMAPIDITAVPASIGFDSPDTDELADQMQELADAIASINDGVGELNNGTAELRSGASSLQDGSNEFQRGMNELDGSSHELVQGSAEMLTGFQTINEGLANGPDVPDLSELQALPENMRTIAANIRKLNEGLTMLDQAIKQIPDNPVSNEQIQSVYDTLIEHESEESVIEVVQELETTYRVAQEIRSLSETIPVSVIQANEEIAAVLEGIASGLEEALSEVSLFDDLAEMQTGLTEMASTYEQFHNGLVTYTDGVHTLTSSYGELNNGMNEFAGGLAELQSGMQTLHAGTTELHDETSELPEEFQSEIEQFMDEFDFSDYEATSFVSEENTDVNVVQFVLQTERIKMKEVEEIVEEEPEEKKGFFEKFFDLFR